MEILCKYLIFNMWFLCFFWVFFEQKYPIVWQGHLALKNDSAAVQLHFVSGNNVLAHRSLPPSEGGPPLRIAQRMRLEASQLEGVARRMTVSTFAFFNNFGYI